MVSSLYLQNDMLPLHPRRVWMVPPTTRPQILSLQIPLTCSNDSIEKTPSWLPLLKVYKNKVQRLPTTEVSLTNPGCSEDPIRAPNSCCV